MRPVADISNTQRQLQPPIPAPCQLSRAQPSLFQSILLHRQTKANLYETIRVSRNESIRPGRGNWRSIRSTTLVRLVMLSS